MHIAKLHIEKFMGIGEATLRMIDTGLVLIQGENRDDPSANSNGSCKSTIPDALAWCLWGETARGIKGDDIINNKYGKGTRVQMWILDGGTTYKIERHRKYPQMKNALMVYVKDGKEWKDISKGTDRGTQSLVEKIIGASREIFNAAVYAAQDALPDLPSMTDKNLKMIIEEAAGVTLLERAYELARASYREDQEAVEKVFRRVNDLTSEAESMKLRVEETEQSIEDWNGDRQVKILQHKANAKYWAEIAKERFDQAAQIDVKKIQDGIAKIDTKIASISQENEKLNELRRVVNKCEMAVDQAENNRVSCENSAHKAQRAGDNSNNLIGTPCGECGRDYTENEIKDARDNFYKKAEDHKTDAEVFVQELLEAEKSLADARKAVEDYRATMTDVSSSQQARKTLENKIKEHSDLISQATQAQNDAKRLLQQMKDTQAETNPHIKYRDAVKAQYDEVIEQLEEAKAAIPEAEKDLEISGTVMGVYSPAGVRAHILDQVTPFLNARTAHYLGTLSDGLMTAVWNTLTRNKGGDFREKFSIEVSKEGGAQIFAGLSGGEKRKVRLSCALAMQDLVASRASKPINLWIGDEIDDALDSSGLERLMGVLEEKAREKGSVLIISHNDIRDWVRDTVSVIRENGISRVEGVLNI